ncbi:MAG: ParB/RepB/Spo0J family partition protein [Bdellovibrionales bacterium]|nr:ParB/RepB/Spo0J family partition protein [Bdellovibrionales bacterium]
MSDFLDAHLKKSGKKQVLGRGLGSLLGEPAAKRPGSLNKTAPIGKLETGASHPLPEAPILRGAKEARHESVRKMSSPQPSIPESARIWNVAIEKIHPNSHQPRKVFVSEHIKELSDSIREKGILQPIVARKTKDGNYEIIAGERRWRAAQQAGLNEVPLILKETDDQEALEFALIENIQRQDLNPIEEAEAYAHLINKHQLTQQKLADKLGKDRVTIANTMRLLNLAAEVRSMVSKGELSLGQAKVLLSVDNDKTQYQLACKVKNDKLSVRATEKLVLRTFKVMSGEKDITELNLAEKSAQVLAEELQKVMGTKVDIDYSSGQGKLLISFYSDDDLNNLADKLRKLWQK